MAKYSMSDFERWSEITDKYIEIFGEEALVPYVTNVEETVNRYEECISKGKSYEELYGEFPADVNY